MSVPFSPEQGTTAAADGDSGELGSARLEALGRLLRQTREAQGLSTTVLADRLRLGVGQLTALESADRDRLPEPVFVIAQARRVAAALQLDINAELQALRDSGELQPRPRPGALQLPRQLSQVTAPSPSDAVATAPEPATAAPEPGGPLLSGASANRLLGAAGGLLLLLLAVGVGWRFGATALKSRVPIRPSAAASPARQGLPPASDAVASGMVVLASPEASWLEVRRPDGAFLYRGLLQGSRVFSLEPGLEVMAARPDLVTSRIGSSPAQPLGPISEVRWRSLPAER